MKNLTGALLFSLSLLFTTGCPKNTGESPDRTDPMASERADSGTPDASQAGLQAGTEAGQNPGRGAMGTDTQEACVDRWLEGKKLDRYGHEQGTMYAGGSPLFNEATGESKDRLEYIFARHPEARSACASKDGGGSAR